MDQDRYGSRPRWHKLVFGLPIAIMLAVVGGYWTLLSWGVIGDTKSETFAIIGPLLAGLGVALGWVIVQRRD